MKKGVEKDFVVKEKEEKMNEAKLRIADSTSVPINNIHHIVAGCKTYILVNEKNTWEDGRKICVKMGGDIASINTIKDQKLILDEMKVVFPGQMSYYVGAKGDGKMFKWVTGERLEGTGFIMTSSTELENCNSSFCIVMHPNILRYPKNYGFCSHNCQSEKKATVCEVGY